MRSYCDCIAWTAVREPVRCGIAFGLLCTLVLGLQTAKGQAAVEEPADDKAKVAPGTAPPADAAKPVARADDGVSVKVTLDSVDDHFAPSAESAEIKYTITDGDVTHGEIRIYKTVVNDEGNQDLVEIRRVDMPNKAEGQWTYNWDGKDGDGGYVGPQDSPYTVKVYAGGKQDLAGASLGTATTEVLVESITVTLGGAAVDCSDDPAVKDYRVYMNNPQSCLGVLALVKIKKKDNTGCVTAIPIYVDFSFSDPGDPNTPKADSFEYDEENHLFLGKAGDGDAVYWGEDPVEYSFSSDGYKLVCRGRTKVGAGDGQGAASAIFLPSGVGGDDFKLKAAVLHNSRRDAEDKTVQLKAVESDVFTVWRQIRVTARYEMNGESHLSQHAPPETIDPYFREAFVDYDEGVAEDPTIPEAQSVKYIGLWDSTKPGNQIDWATFCQPLPSETPTDAELVAADDGKPDDDVRKAARNAVNAKAQAWVDRIEGACLDSFGAWSGEGGPSSSSLNGCLVGIRHYHPKFSPDAGESATDFWPRPGSSQAWVTVKTYWGQVTEADPDGTWCDLRGAYVSTVEITGSGLTQLAVATVARGGTQLQTRRTTAHEIGTSRVTTSHEIRSGQGTIRLRQA